MPPRPSETENMDDAIEKNKRLELWSISVGAWKDQAVVTDFMRDEIGGLRDKNAEPLPEIVKQFLTDLLFLRTKPRRGRYLPKEAIREQYRILLFFEQRARESDPTKPLRGDSPAQTVMNELAAKFRTSVATIDQIVSPRKSRQPRKPHKS